MKIVLRNATDAWGFVAKSFHWLIAVLIGGQLVLGKVAEEAALSPDKIKLFVWHKSIGVTILLLVVLRLAWRLGNPPPQPAGTVPRWEIGLARAGHALLYLLMFAVPLSGWWASDTTRLPFEVFWLIPVPDLLPADRAMHELAGEVHETLNIALLVVVVGHAAASLRHHFLLRDPTLTRMLPGRRQ